MTAGEQTTLIRVRDTRFDDPVAVGSLRSALRLWDGTVRGGSSEAPYSVRFTYTCRSEARALRVAGALRRRKACAAARPVASSRPGSQLWHVQGRTHARPQSLASLGQVSNWLRGLAASHQVSLVRLALS